MIEIEEHQPLLHKKVTRSTEESHSASDKGDDIVWEDSDPDPIGSVWRWDNKDSLINIEDEKSYFQVFD